MTAQKTSLHAYFSPFPDPRVERNKKHLLSDIIILSIMAVLCGAESWNAIELYGRTKHEFLKTILKLPYGIPSHDTINRVFSVICPKVFERMFSQWAQSLKNPDIKKDVIAIDGKTIKGSKDTFHGNKAIHIVSAWRALNGIALGQLKTDEKSNEITAIPMLLDMLDIEGETVTIDAMGAQTKIADKIVDGGGDYILSVKSNQKELLAQIENAFESQPAASVCEESEKGHGRIETRRCQVITNLEFIDNRRLWTNLSCAVRIDSQRIIGEKVEKQTRYYISSLPTGTTAQTFNASIRRHWAVENNLHWTLDMVFNEDRQRKRIKNAAQNFSLIRKITLNLLKLDSSKDSLVSKRLRAGWDNKFLLDLLNIYMR